MLPTITLSERTFWDVDLNDLDFATSHEWIINRVFDRGSLDEVLSVINYYGFNFVKESLKKTSDNLPSHALLLARAIFKLDYHDFKCCIRKPHRQP